MRETLNKYYSYPGKELWDAIPKAPVPILPLTTRISKLNNAHHKVPAKPESERRHDGYYNAKAFAYVHNEVLAALGEKGLSFYMAAMWEMSYITIVPECHLSPARKRYDDAMDTLLIMVTADITDPNYAMYTLQRYADYIDMAAREHIALHFAMYRGVDDVGRALFSLRESMVIHRFNPQRLYLDVSTVYLGGGRLDDTEGLHLPVSADEAAIHLGSLDIPALNIAPWWLGEFRPEMTSFGSTNNMDFNSEMYICSGMGRRKAKATLFVKDHRSIHEPLLRQKLEAMGLVFGIHETDGEQWLLLAPRQAVEEGRKLPIIGYFGENCAFDPSYALATLQASYDFVELAAEGNFALLLFALEDPDANDRMETLIREAAVRYPIDLERVYITGHSHNGRFAAEFARRHQDLVAAVAPLGNEPGQLSPEVTSGYFAVSDEQLLHQASVDTPVIVMCGCNETNCMYPLYTDAPFPNPSTPFIALNTKEKRVKSWQRRLISSNCPMKSEGEIYATQYSGDYVERTLGIPADKTQVLYVDGCEVYIADIKNNNGDYHLRICGFQNTSHAYCPSFAGLMWSFCRRFARSQDTGETIELY